VQEAFHVAGSNIISSSESESDLQDDPRGVVWMYAEPKPHAKYVMGCDPTVGVTGWQRHLRVDGDHKTDNCAIEIFEIDGEKVKLVDEQGKAIIDPVTKIPKFYYRDVQVAEYAAPIDAVEAARVCNILGRVYAGEEQDQCLLIFESYPGPGMLTLQELLRLGYANLWHWEYFADSIAEETNRIGWRSHHESQKVLWYRARRHLMEHRAKIQSKWLLEEYSNAVIDVEKMRARAAYGSHDDRIQAASMVFWAGHGWAYDVERTSEEVTAKPEVDWQQQAPVLGEYRSYKDAWSDVVDSWY
jgi:hypothetical protein